MRGHAARGVGSERTPVIGASLPRGVLWRLVIPQLRASLWAIFETAGHGLNAYGRD